MPSAVLTVPLLTNLPGAFTLAFQAGAVHPTRFGFARGCHRQGTGQGTTAFAHSAVVRHRHFSAQPRPKRTPQSFRLTLGQSKAGAHWQPTAKRWSGVVDRFAALARGFGGRLPALTASLSHQVIAPRWTSLLL